MNFAAASKSVVATYQVLPDQACMDESVLDTALVYGDFRALFSEERAEFISRYLDRAARGEEVVTFEQLANGELRLLVLEASGAGKGELIAWLIRVDDIAVPEHLTGRVLGMRAAVIHQICNDLSAARLNSELADKILQGAQDTVDPRVVDALHSVIRLSKTVETQLRELQRNVKLNLQGTIDE